jgi:hypothetical protein
MRGVYVYVKPGGRRGVCIYRGRPRRVSSAHLVCIPSVRVWCAFLKGGVYPLVHFMHSFPYHCVHISLHTSAFHLCCYLFCIILDLAGPLVCAHTAASDFGSLLRLPLNSAG